MSPGRTGRWVVDVRGFEPLTPCLQSRLGKTLNAFAGVAYTENHQNSRSLIVPKLYRDHKISFPETAQDHVTAKPFCKHRRRAGTRKFIQPLA